MLSFLNQLRLGMVHAAIPVLPEEGDIHESQHAPNTLMDPLH
jgi:hypothetical protein